MAEDFTSAVLRQIQADIAEVKAGMQAGFGRIENAQAQQGDMVRGLASIMVGIAGRLEGIEARLGRIEREHT